MRALLAQQCVRHPQQLLRLLAAPTTPAARLANLCTTAAAQGPERSFPTEPRVGVGVVVFRRPPAPGLAPDVSGTRLGAGSGPACAGARRADRPPRAPAHSACAPPARSCCSSSAPRSPTGASGASPAGALSSVRRAPVAVGSLTQWASSTPLPQPGRRPAHTGPCPHVHCGWPRRRDAGRVRGARGGRGDGHHAAEPQGCACHASTDSGAWVSLSRLALGVETCAPPPRIPAEVDLVEDEEGFSDDLLVPTAFAAVDSIVMADGSTVTSGGGGSGGGAQPGAGPDQRTLPRFHYAIIEVRLMGGLTAAPAPWAGTARGGAAHPLQSAPRSPSLHRWRRSCPRATCTSPPSRWTTRSRPCGCPPTACARCPTWCPCARA